MLVVAVHAVVNGDVAHAVHGEIHLHVLAGQQVVAAQTGEVFGHDTVDFSGFNISYHALEVRTVKVRAAVPVVYVLVNDPQAVFLGVPAEHHALGGDGIALPRIVIVAGKTVIKAGIIYRLFHK